VYLADCATVTYSRTRPAPTSHNQNPQQINQARDKHSKRRKWGGLTEDDNIQDQHDKSQNTTPSTILPSIAMARSLDHLVRAGEGEEREVEEESEEG
jgi:hypothetical protein